MVATTIPQEHQDRTTRYTIGSVQSAFDLLFAFLQSRTGTGKFGVSDLARHCGQTKNQTFRLLQTMAAAGIVIQDPEDRTYSLGYRLIELGAAAHARSNLVHAARATLNRLSAETGDEINLGTLTADFATVLLDSRQGTKHVFDYRPLGKRSLLHAGAGSKVLLAFSPPEYLEEYIRVASPLKRFTPYTCVQPVLLRDECAKIRGNGYAVSFQDFDLQRCSIAVPIRDARNEVIAGLGMASTPAAFGEGVRRQRLAMLLAASEEISARLGRRV